MKPDITNSIIEKMRDNVKKIDPQRLSHNTGAVFHSTEEHCATKKHCASEKHLGDFKLIFFGESITVTYPEFIIRESDSNEEVQEHIKALLLYYFTTADGTPPGGKWIALSELPDGGFYNQAYQGYSGNRLVKAFANDLDSFRNSAFSWGGTAESFGDLSFSFQALPNVKLLAVYWKGDEEFSPTAKVLFDSSARHYLPTDLCAFLGSILTKKLIETK
ncbi:MAG: DUF3786 domain-containing protein [Spirochaetota bacterium]|nr:MAG: DUF3786 domain-containing protein [Spirochaetota bacterium]